MDEEVKTTDEVSDFESKVAKKDTEEKIGENLKMEKAGEKIKAESKGKKQASMKLIFAAMALSMLIAIFWNNLTFLKEIIHSLLNPTAGALLSWNLTWGMMVIVLILTTITTLIQKYTTDQEAIRELKEKQKEISRRAQEHKDNPQKMMEINKEGFPLMGQMFKLSMRAFTYTAIPLILFFRWFVDTFNTLGSPEFFGFLSWFWFYLIFSMIFSSILRKIFKVV